MNKASDKIADLLKAKYDVKIQFSASVRVWPEMLKRRFFLLFSFNGGVLFEVKISYV